MTNVTSGHTGREAQLPLDQAPEAHRRIESGTSVGMLVLAVDGG
jgi:hypothetical protein